MIAALVRDLMIASRIEEAARSAGVGYRRLDGIEQVSSATDARLIVVDWSEREPDWPDRLAAWRDASMPPRRVIVFGRHTDLEAHAAAKRAGLGPMWARSRLVADLPRVLRGRSLGSRASG